ncbi:hypothetical protein COCNU_06G018310 [Cocos nucifera]|uniref:Uncharacterized protein n=1 Tax=Cocos nucifera TaxID=13894 RepID=A0A8K0IDT4_COCNU|nr:hypothetical protein COCNU_06G018310 [Cocos nucifera]
MLAEAISSGGPLLLEDVIEGHAGGGVECLAKDSGINAGEEGGDALKVEDMGIDSERVGAGMVAMALVWKARAGQQVETTGLSISPWSCMRTLIRLSRLVE